MELVAIGGVFGAAKEAGAALTGWPGVKDWLAGCKTRLLKGRVTPGNHDLVRGIRTAQLCALDHVARRHDALLKTLPAYETGGDERPFAASLRAFLDARLKPFDQGAVDHDALKIEDIEHALDAMVHPESAEGYGELADRARAGAETRMLAEVERDAGRLAPPWFRRAFRGEGGAGWYDACALFVTEALKTDERFRSIFFAAELIDIKRALDKRIADIKTEFPDLTDFMADVRTRLHRIEEKVDKVLAGQARHSDDIGDVKAELAALKRLLLDNAKGAFAPNLPEQVSAAVDRLGEERSRGSNVAAEVVELLKQNRVADAVELRVAAAEEHARRAKEASVAAAEEFRQAAALAATREPWRARDLYARAAALDPSHAEGQFWHGWYQLEAGDLMAAASAFKAAILASNDQDSFANFWSLVGLGDVKMAQGDLPGALKSFEAGLAIAERLAKSDPGNAGWQRDLSVSFVKIGDVKVAQGDLPGALKSYEAALAIADRLAKSDPGNAGWQRDLSVSFEKIGDVKVAQGDLPGALKSYEAGLAIRDRLAKSDAGNAGWQRDLSVSFNKIGDVKVAQGDLPGALTSYEAALAIRDRLAKSDPGNAGWQRDLSVSSEKIGDVKVAQGDLPGALKSYEAGLAIRDRLATTDAGNAGWQRDLAISHGRVADIDAELGRKVEALARFRKAHDIIKRLIEISPTNATLPKDLVYYESRIAELERQ